MIEIYDKIVAKMHRDSHPKCPHCGAEIDMTDTERTMSHVTYWGEDEAVGEDCPKCNVTVYLKEHVSRHWTIGRTPAEAEEL